MKLNVKEFYRLLCVISMVLALSVASCSAADAWFEMSNQNGMPIGEDGSFPLPLYDSVILNASNQESSLSYNWTIRNSAEEVVFSYNGTSPIFPGSIAGLYNATLEVSENPDDTASITRPFLIADSYYIAQANFSSSIDYEVNPANVTIFDLSQRSSPVFGWWWSIDGEEVSGFESPIIYQDLGPGMHEVNLSIVVDDPLYGVGTSSISKPVTVSRDRRLIPLEGLIPSFTMISDSDNPNNITFIDTSKGSPESWFWQFGDGYFEIVQNPTHQYKEAVTYPVTLTVMRDHNRKSFHDNVTIGLV